MTRFKTCSVTGLILAIMSSRISNQIGDLSKCYSDLKEAQESGMWATRYLIGITCSKTNMQNSVGSLFLLGRF